ncbi:TIGR04438 family Trp-rich protein [Methylibium rhizosphaerae]|uniref:TIGR04438 family Trp-rich protein n=1 Tax=Methylibium rhizosphaerae TaxID=2570323 RepID=UPI00112A4C78|nr:TIGR04438 family Trp-rich protein [Methylibium rhizosphaerae]
MWFVVLGVLLLLMKMTDFGPVGAWSWLWILAPFGAAVVWWAWADATGFTKRRQMEKMDAKRAERRKSQMAALGMEPRKRKKR